MYEQGSTVHSRFGISIFPQPDGTFKAKVSAKRQHLLRSTYLIIIDEVSIMHREVLNALDKLMREIRGVDQPMGGCFTILAGDFRQLVVIIKSQLPQEVLNATIKASHLWKTVTIHHLNQMMRSYRSWRSTWRRYISCCYR